MYKKLLFIISIFFLTSASFSQDHQQWSYNLSIYEVNVRQYTQAGTFAAFESHLDRLKDMGAGILWFMPIHPIGVQNRLGSLGSYYSIKDYLDINPEFGTMEDFKSLVNKIHQRGMYVMIDWVANHTSWDNNLTITHPEWYSKDSNGNFIFPPGTNWTDVIDLDYNQQGLRDYMIDAMKYWINETGIDGFRCDAAAWVPLDFWSDAIAALKSIKPDLLMLAEADGTQFNSAGFDITYAWGFYGFGNGILKNIVNGTNNATSVYYYFNAQGGYPVDHYRMYFTSNHDENSWHGTVFELFGGAAEVFTVLAAIFNDIPLIYSGQEAGLNKRLLFFDKDLIPWQQHYFADIYSTLLKLKKENKALWNVSTGSEYKRINTTNNEAVYSFVRKKDNDKIFAILNLSEQDLSFNLLDSSYVDNYINVFTNDSVSLSAGLQVNLAPWGYILYKKGGGISALNNYDKLPVNYSLSQNYPNPFNSATRINYSIPESDFVSITVYDILGNKISVLVNGEKPAGTYILEFRGDDLSAGIYFYRLQAGKFSDTKKFILLK